MCIISNVPDRESLQSSAHGRLLVPRINSKIYSNRSVSVSNRSVSVSNRSASVSNRSVSVSNHSVSVSNGSVSVSNRSVSVSNRSVSVSDANEWNRLSPYLHNSSILLSIFNKMW